MTKQQRKITNLQREISNNTINDVKQISLSHVITDKIFKLVENQVQHCQKKLHKKMYLLHHRNFSPGRCKWAGIFCKRDWIFECNLLKTSTRADYGIWLTIKRYIGRYWIMLVDWKVNHETKSKHIFKYEIFPACQGRLVSTQVKEAKHIYILKDGWLHVYQFFQRKMSVIDFISLKQHFTLFKSHNKDRECHEHLIDSADKKKNRS